MTDRRDLRRHQEGRLPTADGGRRGGKGGGRGRLAREPRARSLEGHIFIHVGQGARRLVSVGETHLGGPGRRDWEGDHVRGSVTGRHPQGSFHKDEYKLIFG